MDQLACLKIKCKDCLTEDGDPAWCYRAGCPAVSAAAKCPKVMGKQIVLETNSKEKEGVKQ